MIRTTLLATFLGLAACAAHAAPTTYIIDPSHTFPSFEADHMGGVSIWRGKFNTNSGTVVLDKAAGAGSVEIVIDTASIDFGHDGMNEHARAPDYFDTEKHPQARYSGKLVDFVEGKPTRVAGTLTLRGVSKPVDLKINSFKCIPHPLHKRELCGADAIATIQRDEFGISAGKDWGFDMAVTLRIQVEAVAEE
ncbi:MAG: polyisoprenoid-binding protein [Xanthomonadaceae bacterium]|nr:polyisoprenoid-binding protein [Xanthomonadaceae bacterium]